MTTFYEFINVGLPISALTMYSRGIGSMVKKIERSVFFSSSVESVFEFHTNMATICKMVPDFLRLKIVSAPKKIKQGDKVFLMGFYYIFPFVWKARIVEYVKNVSFTDVLVIGLFSYWRHEHLFKASDGGTLMTDRVYYTVPFGGIGEFADDLLIHNELEAIFKFRHMKALDFFS